MTRLPLNKQPWLRMMRSFLATAMYATFGGFAAWIRRSYSGVSTGWKRDAFIAAR
jgi:hypothetical protein